MRIQRLQVTSPAPRDVWQTVFSADPEAVPYQSPAWLDSLCANGGYDDASCLFETTDGRKFIMPLVRRKGWPAALTTAASLPNGWGMGGLLSSGPACQADMAAIFATVGQLPFMRVSVRPNPRLAELWAGARPPGVTAIPRLAHVLDLDGGFDHVWSKRFDKKTRWAVRKAERSGVVIECDTTGRLIPVFHDLLRRSFDRWARQQNEPRWLAHWRGRERDPLHKFQIIARQLGEACRVWVAWVNGQPAAAMLVLQYGNVNDSRGAMDKELVAQTNANDLLQKMAIEEACRVGCRHYHLGESGSSASLAHFKSRFGAVAYPYAEYHLERLPLTRMDGALRRVVKRLIGFRDVV